MTADFATGDERCGSCRGGLEPGEPYRTVQFAAVGQHQAPVCEVWCVSCAWEDEDAA